MTTLGTDAIDDFESAVQDHALEGRTDWGMLSADAQRELIAQYVLFRCLDIVDAIDQAFSSDEEALMARYLATANPQAQGSLDVPTYALGHLIVTRLRVKFEDIAAQDFREIADKWTADEEQRREEDRADALCEERKD